MLLEERKAWMQSEIQNAAKKLFLEKGFEDTTVEEIARIAGVGKGSIYNYFKSKDDLYLSLMIPLIMEINHSLRKVKKRVSKKNCPTPRDFIMLFLEHYKQIYNKDPEGILMIQKFQLGDHASQLSEKNNKLIIKYARNNFIVSRETFLKAMNLNIIPKKDPIILSDWFWATFFGVVQLEYRKLKATNKDHILPTLETVFEIIGDLFNSHVTTKKP